MASLPKVLPNPDLKMDIDKVPPSPKRQLEEDTTSAQDNEELCGYAQTAVQEASPEVRAGPPHSRARARDCLTAGSDNPAKCASDRNAVIGVAPFNAAPSQRRLLHITVCLRDQQRACQQATAKSEL